MKLLNPTDATKFILAGNATFTVVRPAREKDGVTQPEARFTYKLTRAKGSEPKRPWFVKVLTGCSNESDYTFLGTVFPEGSGLIYRHSFRKSPIAETAPSARGIGWLIRHLSELQELSAAQSATKAQEGVFANVTGTVLDEQLKEIVASLSRLQVWHEGRCGRCGRKLTVPSSIETGLGPECAGKN